MAEIGNGAAGDPNHGRLAWVPLAVAVAIVGAVLAPLLVGVEPVGGDPELMYRPIKHELAAALRQGSLPYWSDRLGLGTPLVAESHAAAFYPPNWIAYSLLDVPAAYRLLMWAHFLACAAATYAYARTLTVSTWGAALAAVAFTLGGFQAAHACHEPFYTLMPYLPLTLLLAERFLASGRAAWLAALALAWGTQILIGHFQIQMWTGGLVALTALARLVHDRSAWRRVGILMTGLIWGLAVAGVQLRLTSELTRVSGFDRPAKAMMIYASSLHQLLQWILPPLYLGRNQNPSFGRNDNYWASQATTPEESCTTLGVVALVFACVGLMSRRLVGRSTTSKANVFRPTESTFSMWFWVSATATVLATMPRWWPDGYMLILNIPGFGLFRAPGRYMVLPSLGLALWAGRGLDQTIEPRRFRGGLFVAGILLIAALVFSIGHVSNPDFRITQGESTISWRYAASLLTWVLTLAAITAWRRGRLGGWAPLLVATLELGGMFYLGPTSWSHAIPSPETSPILSRLKQEQHVGLVAGRLQNLPIRAGFTVSYPIVGITAPPPNYLLEPSFMQTPAKLKRSDIIWQRRFGVTHGIWKPDDAIQWIELIDEIEDPVLDHLVNRDTNGKSPGRWKLGRYANPFPEAWIATRFKEAAGWPALYSNLSEADHTDEAWFLPEDRPAEAKPDPTRDPTAAAFGLGLPEKADLDLGPRATSTRLVEWDGRSGTVEHDGSCVLILRRAYYPGWKARINGGPEKPVAKVSGGLQGVVFTGKGPSQVTVSYRPSRLGLGIFISLSATAAAFVTLGMSARRSYKPSA